MQISIIFCPPQRVGPATLRHTDYCGSAGTYAVRQSGELPETPFFGRHQPLGYEDVTKIHLRQMTIHTRKLHERETVQGTGVGKDDREEYDKQSLYILFT